MATNIDSFAHQHQELVILFSAGNDGEKSTTAQIGSHAGSKNVITVGACESSHPILYTPAVEPPPIGQPRYKCVKGQPTGVISNVATFSSRGPTRENRIKPDLVAPGVCLYSTRSQCEGFQGFKVPGTDTGNQGIKYDYNVHGESDDKPWAFASGTSFATTPAAGCAAVLRNLLRTSAEHPSPTAALIKALLVNRATDLSGKGPTRGPAIGPAPDPAQGFGRVNMTASIRNVTNRTFLESPPCRQGEVFTKKLEIPKPNAQQTRTLTATMGFLRSSRRTASEYTSSQGSLFGRTNQVCKHTQCCGCGQQCSKGGVEGHSGRRNDAGCGSLGCHTTRSRPGLCARLGRRVVMTPKAKALISIEMVAYLPRIIFFLFLVSNRRSLELNRCNWRLVSCAIVVESASLWIPYDPTYGIEVVCRQCTTIARKLLLRTGSPSPHPLYSAVPLEIPQIIQ
jgi:hypothetical protein